MTQAAQLLGVSRPTLYRLAKMPGFPIIHLGGCTRILVDDLRAWARQQTKEDT
uniref:Helix-turn-helix domain protein n=1 Tax=Siphoviridae sp. ctOba29 TaxID=2825480 RepID=A0A8S5NVU1_9CAUD|nr:MAG TPA: helix-turn-helix domain protein [Siphoviridae sp. ctOba29]